VDTAARPRARWTDWVAYALAAAFLFGAVMHGRALVQPPAAPDSPPWRHALFLALNLVCVAGFLRRPWYFLPAFVVLAIQQGSTHGVDAVQAAARGVFAGDDIAVMATFVLGIGLLVLEATRRGESTRSGANRDSRAVRSPETGS